MGDKHKRKRHSHHGRHGSNNSHSSTSSSSDYNLYKKKQQQEEIDSNLNLNFTEINSQDFFNKSLEFKVWLKQEKNKFLDQLDSYKSKKYFEKFVKRWNKGKLNPDYYNPPAHWRTSSGLTSSHSWTFKDTTVLEREKAKRALEEASIGPNYISAIATTSKRPNVIIGPSLPPPPPSSLSTNLAEHQYQLDQEHDSNVEEMMRRKRELNRKRKEEREEENSHKATGKDRLLEKRLENRRARSEYQREKDDPTSLEIDDRSLFGSSNSFQEAIRARNEAQERRTGKNSTVKMEKQLMIQEKLNAMKSKESETMAMFKALADSKFGQGSKS